MLAETRGGASKRAFINHIDSISNDDVHKKDNKHKGTDITFVIFIYANFVKAGFSEISSNKSHEPMHRREIGFLNYGEY